MIGRHVVAVDLGADSGRVIKVTFDGQSLHMEDVHRFPNSPVHAGGTLYWDALRLWHEMRTGIDAALSGDKGAASIGLDTWGVDFALLDRNGQLIGNPVHYRDHRNDGMMEWVFERIPRRVLFERTGIQFMQLNGLYQIASMIKANSPQLDIAATFVTITDLFNYWLTGSKQCEYTMATTMQMVNPRTGAWDFETLTTLGVRTDMFPAIVQPGTRIGDYDGVPVVLPGCHDTASAVVAVPTTTPNYCYISSGTWSLMGLEIDEPVIDDASYAANVTNEGGVEGTFRLLKNVAGMWFAQQSRYTWRAQGTEYSYDDLTALAREATPFTSFIDVDDHLFLAPGDIPGRIQDFCRRTGQPVPRSHAEIMRVAFESLALKYRWLLDRLIGLSDRSVDRIHIVGGGSKNALLCQMTADACNREVIAGPVEATALGNAIVQLIALGEFSNVAQARAMLSQSPDLRHYTPANTAAWDEAYGRFQQFITTD